MDKTTYCLNSDCKEPTKKDDEWLDHRCVKCGEPGCGVCLGIPVQYSGPVHHSCLIDKPKWQPATKENLVVGEWYWVDEVGNLFGPLKFERLQKKYVYFCHVMGMPVRIDREGTKIQPATAPPELEEQT